MKFLRFLAADLGDKRLWPVVAVLAVCALAIPVGVSLTTGSPTPKPAPAPAPLPSQPVGTPAPGQALQVVAGPGTPKGVHYRSPERDPFRVAAAASTGTISAASGGAVGTATRVAPTVVPTPPKVSVPTTKTTKPATKPATPKPQVVAPIPVSVPGLPKLTKLDSYAVTVAVKDASGSRTYPNVERLSLLPSPGLPELIYLGVLKGGRGVAFLHTARAAFAGPGICVPSNANCQVLVVRPGVAVRVTLPDSGFGSTTFSFAVTGVSVERHRSAARARKARRQEYGAGRQLMQLLGIPALSGFVYTIKDGAITQLAAKAAAGASRSSGPAATIDRAVPTL